MESLGILLTGGPFDSQRWHTAYELGRTALDRGHEVTYFQYLDGTFVPVQTQSQPECGPGSPYDPLPADAFRTLLDRGATVICCGLCVDIRGIDRETAYPDGVTVGLLGDLAELLGSADRVISL